MLEIRSPVIWVLIGIVFVTVVDVSGSILSRKFRFSYGYFIIPSAVAYISLSYGVFNRANYLTTFSVLFITGIYDIIIGWWLSEKLKAYYSYTSLELKGKITFWHRLFSIIIFLTVFGWIGIWLKQKG